MTQKNKVALITGSAKRVGACVAQYLHQKGFHVIIHYKGSSDAAQRLCTQLNQIRPDSAIACQANLQHPDHISDLIDKAITQWGRLDALINNAATFEATSIDQVTYQDWEKTISSNLTAPFFLALAATPYLRKAQGSIINMTDIRATQPLKHYTPYCISKAGLLMATKSLALELAPDIRVNGIAPGVVLWPDEQDHTQEKMQQKIIARTPLKRAGTPEDIAKAAYFLLEKAPYMTGQILSIDGGRLLL